jgi:hypothetical protein
MRRGKIPAAGTKKKARGESIKFNLVGTFACPSAERDAAIERIVNAVNKQPDSEDALADDIDQIELGLVESLNWKKASAGKAQKSIKRIRRNLEDAANRIDSDTIIRKSFDIHGLRRMAKQARHFEEWQRNRRRAQRLRTESGDRLADVDRIAPKLRETYKERFSSALLGHGMKMNRMDRLLILSRRFYRN